VEHGKIAHYFGFGGYGSDHGNRTHVVKHAVRRGSDYVAPAEVTRAIVIGDTPRDIIHAKEAGASVIAVATGFHSRETLSEFGPDLVLESLEDRKAFREFLAVQ
ncbi:MAG: HAD hydrolase-like protein, partial [Anaerolineales bacterium]|nr:HAD hydrolase-like protein [Anaerolineales bacterium]